MSVESAERTVIAPSPEGAGEQALVEEWRTLLRRYSTTSCALDRALHEKHGLGVSEFEILDRLSEAAKTRGDGKVRMQELGEQVHLTQSALSRAVARLEREDLVERCMCPQDRRGVFVILQPAGRKLHRAAVKTHRAVLAEALHGTEGC